MPQILTDACSALENMACREPPFTVLDLFSGLGGATASFHEAGDEVLRIDNNPLLADVPRTLCSDVSSVESQDAIQNLGNIDLVWASPPCVGFSTGYAAPSPTARREGRTPFPDLGLLRQAVRVIEDTTPEWWVIENVVGAIRYFKPYLGNPSQIIGPFVLWGRFPHLTVDLAGHSKAKSDTWSTDPLRANKKALVPYPISEALRNGMCSEQFTLGDFS